MHYTLIREMRSSACSLLQLRKKTVFLFPIKLEKNNNLVKTICATA